MSEEKRRRLSIAEKRAMTGLLNLGPEFRQIDPVRPEPAEPHWSNALLPDAVSKKPISLRIDPDVLEFYKADGPGYQTRMNAVLRAYMQARMKIIRP